MIVFPAVSRVMFKACRMGTPLVTSVPSVRLKREIEPFLIRLPKSGARKVRASITVRPFAVLPAKV